jgi:hypothetical protein
LKWTNAQLELKVWQNVWSSMSKILQLF